MAGTIKTQNIQLGDSATATNNFVLSVPASPDGTVKLSRGNVGATTQDVLVVDASGLVKLTQGLQSLGNYANDGAAATGGVAVNALYRNGSVLMVRVA